jgi:hypothetical protein
MKRRLRIAGSISLAAFVLIGCAGRPAKPVMVYQPADVTKPCHVLDGELEVIEKSILDLIPQTDKTAKNIQLGVAGIFLLVPLLFMDLSKAEQIEVNALTKRYNYLLSIGDLNSCDLKRVPIPDFEKRNY